MQTRRGARAISGPIVFSLPAMDVRPVRIMKKGMSFQLAKWDNAMARAAVTYGYLKTFILPALMI